MQKRQHNLHFSSSTRQYCKASENKLALHYKCSTAYLFTARSFVSEFLEDKNNQSPRIFLMLGLLQLCEVKEHCYPKSVQQPFHHFVSRNALNCCYFYHSLALSFENQKVSVLKAIMFKLYYIITDNLQQRNEGRKKNSVGWHRIKQKCLKLSSNNIRRTILKPLRKEVLMSSSLVSKKTLLLEFFNTINFKYSW